MPEKIAMTDAYTTVFGNIPLLCRCGNAVLRARLAHEIGARAVVTSCCPLCDEGNFEELFYTDATGRGLTYVQWMESRGLEP